MHAERRGFSTFELMLQVSALPRLGDPVLVEPGIVHLGNSSIRFMHRMCDPTNGNEFARLGQFGVQLDLDTRRPAPLPEALRNAAKVGILAASLTAGVCGYLVIRFGLPARAT